MSRYTNTVPQIIDENGLPIVGAKKFFFEPNSTTFRTVYTNSGLNIPADNPQLSDPAGRYSEDIFLDGVYKEEQQDNSGTATGFDGVTLWTKDPVGQVVQGQLSPWINSEFYNIPDIALGTDDVYYVSIIDNNQGNDPTTSPNEWEVIQLGQGGDINLTVIRDVNANESMVITATPTAVNHFDMVNASATNKPTINQIGLDDVGLDIEGVEINNGDITANSITSDIITISLTGAVIGSDNLKSTTENLVSGNAIPTGSSVVISQTGMLFVSVTSVSVNIFIEILINGIWSSTASAGGGIIGSFVVSTGSNLRVSTTGAGATFDLDRIVG